MDTSVLWELQQNEKNADSGRQSALDKDVAYVNSMNVETFQNDEKRE